MPTSPTSRSPDLKRLIDEGYAVALVDGTLIVSDIPFVGHGASVRRGTLSIAVEMWDGLTCAPTRHHVGWTGGQPCDARGEPLKDLVAGRAGHLAVPGIVVDYQLCNKPRGREFHDYHELVSTYVALLGVHAGEIEPGASARRAGRPPVAAHGTGPFRYADTATARSGTSAAMAMIAGQRIGIVGLGGTGSYVLDLVSKTAVSAIHLFDPDRLSQHNAFRSPGAVEHAQLGAGHFKVDHFARTYSAMHRGIVPHPIALRKSTAALLDGLDFVFLCIDDGTAKPTILDCLDARGIAYVDVGMGLASSQGGGVAGAIRTTSGTPESGYSHRRWIPTVDDDGGAYATNVQIAELNALNAAFAVIAWKRRAGFYAGPSTAEHSVFVISSGAIHTETAA